MNASRLVALTLLRMHRQVALWFLSILTVGVAVAMAVANVITDPGFSIWLLVAGSATKYWLLVVGVTFVTVHLRQFVANGVTRRDFIAGMTGFGLLAAVLFALLVPVGHGVEAALQGAAGPLPAGYPEFSAAVGLREFLHVLPAEFAYLASGAAVAAGFYRFGPWPGMALLLPAVLPLGVAEGLLGVDEHGVQDSRLLPYLLVSLAVTAFAALICQRVLRDVAIRPTAG